MLVHLLTLNRLQVSVVADGFLVHATLQLEVDLLLQFVFLAGQHLRRKFPGRPKLLLMLNMTLLLFRIKLFSDLNLEQSMRSLFLHSCLLFLSRKVELALAQGELVLVLNFEERSFLLLLKRVAQVQEVLSEFLIQFEVAGFEFLLTFSLQVCYFFCKLLRLCKHCLKCFVFQLVFGNAEACSLGPVLPDLCQMHAMKRFKSRPLFFGSKFVLLTNTLYLEPCLFSNHIFVLLQLEVFFLD